MVRNPVHEMLAMPTHDESARQHYVLTLKDYIRDFVRANNEEIYQKVAKQKFVRKHNRNPETAEEIGELMWAEPAYQMFSRLHRDGQEMMWDAVADTVYRERQRLTDNFRRYSDPEVCKGELEIDPDFVMPKGMVNVDIHLQPGGYCSDYGEEDILAGAFYESGGNLYTMGRGVGQTESKGEVGVRFIKEKFPNFSPTSILDIGCSAGSSTLPYALTFPSAEVYGIDIAPSILRYAHARAEAIGCGVHFHQRYAENTGYEDEKFDLILSHNAMHEFPQQTTEGMMRESFRLLKPNGIAMHLDVNIRYKEYDPWTEFNRGWDMLNNNEPYWRVYATNEPKEMLVKAGFSEDSIWEGKFYQADRSLKWFIVTARKT